MKRVVLKLTTIACGVIAALFLAELALRLYDHLSSPRPVTYRTNRLGFRDREHSAAKKAGVLRIAFQGDSYTYGKGVEEKDRVSERAGALLSARWPGREIEVLNFGRRGLNIRGNLATLKRNVLSCDPDAIVFGFVLNDFNDPRLERDFIRELRRETAEYKWLRGLERHSDLALFIDRVAINLFSDAQRIHQRFLNDLWSPKANPSYEKDRQRLEELVEIISTRKGIVVFYPYFIAANEKNLPFYRKAKELVMEVCRSRGCRFLEVLPLLSHKPYHYWWVMPEDHHPNAKAHAIIARAVAEILAETL